MSNGDDITEENLVNPLAILGTLLAAEEERAYARRDVNTPIAEEVVDEDDIHRVVSDSYRDHRTSRNITKSSGAIVWVDSESGLVKVRAAFHGDFNILNRPLHGRRFVKEGTGVGYWEFTASPENIEELIKILGLCYKNIIRPPLELIELWELLETEDIEKIYRIVSNRYAGHIEISKKIDKAFKSYIDLEKAHRKVRRVIRTT